MTAWMFDPTAEDRMGFWGTYIVGRSEQALAELPALAPAEDDVAWECFGRDGWQCLQVHHRPDGWDSRDLPGAWEATLRALMEQTGHPVLAAAVLDSDGCQLIGYGPESGRWGGWLMLDRIIGHFHPEAQPQVTLGEDDEDGIPTSVEYKDEEFVRPRYKAAVARLTVAAGPPGSLAAAAAIGWAAEAGLHPDPSAVAAVMDDTDVFAEDHFFAFLTALGVPWFTGRYRGPGQSHRATGPPARRSEPGLQLQGAVSHVAGSCYEWGADRFST